MKQVIVFGLFIFFSVAMFAQNGIDKLPANAKNLITDHFSSVAVEEVTNYSFWEFWEVDKYEVRLANGIEVDFDRRGNVVEIDSKQNVEIPINALPSIISSHIKSHRYKGKIVGWEKFGDQHEVELMNGSEIELVKVEFLRR